MVKILQESSMIEYTRGDTFLIRISPEDGDVFLDGSSLEFIVAEESSKKPIIQKVCDLTEGAFDVCFSNKDREISYGNYIYKMVLRTVDGTIVTQKSGDFVVIWGA